MRFSLVLLLLSTGCAASVSAEALDGGFGPGLSAIRLHTKGEDSDTDSLLISNVGGLCAKWQNLTTATSELLDASSDVMSKHYCENLEEPAQNYVDAAQATYPKGANFLSISVDGGLDEDSFDTPKEAGGGMATVTSVPFDGVMDDFDTDGSVMDGCGVGDDVFNEDFSDTWNIGDGTLELTSVKSEGPVSGTLEAALKDDDGDIDGDIKASFTASFCEIED